MAFTYDLTTNRGKTRLILGDTSTSGSIFGDDEIDYFLSEEGSSVYKAAALGLESLAQRYAHKASFSADGLSVQYNDMAQSCRAQAKELRKRAGGGAAAYAMTRYDGYSDDVTAGS